jgi:dihydrodipicolinate reductase
MRHPYLRGDGNREEQGSGERKATRQEKEKERKRERKKEIDPMRVKGRVPIRHGRHGGFVTIHTTTFTTDTQLCTLHHTPAQY